MSFNEEHQSRNNEDLHGIDPNNRNSDAVLHSIGLYSRAGGAHDLPALNRAPPASISNLRRRAPLQRRSQPRRPQVPLFSAPNLHNSSVAGRPPHWTQLARPVYPAVRPSPPPRQTGGMRRLSRGPSQRNRQHPGLQSHMQPSQQSSMMPSQVHQPSRRPQAYQSHEGLMPSNLATVMSTQSYHQAQGYQSSMGPPPRPAMPNQGHLVYQGSQDSFPPPPQSMMMANQSYHPPQGHQQGTMQPRPMSTMNHLYQHGPAQQTSGHRPW